MTNTSQTDRKLKLRKALYQAAEQALVHDGWSVERVSGTGKSSIRRIRRGSKCLLVSIRTTQDQWIAFPRLDEHDRFGTLPDVDAVVAASVDDRWTPRKALVHLLDGEEMRERFHRAVTARKAAGHALPIGRGVWISLYEEERESPVNRVGAGAGLATPPIARIPLSNIEGEQDTQLETSERAPIATEHLTIPEAKRRLAASFGVEPDNVKIMIEG